MPVSREQPRSAIFLDRDGTIIEDRGNLSHPSQVVFLPGAITTLQAVQRDFVLFIVTNQSGVAKGQLTLEEVATVNASVVADLATAGIRIERVFVCPHARADGCECIKPKPHFLRVAEREHGIDLSRSFTIGDHPHDVEFARSVGATGIYVLTGHGAKHRAELDPAHRVVPSLADALPLLRARSSADPLVAI
jgi:histidinol-phosphate phosphatase family protein